MRNVPATALLFGLALLGGLPARADNLVTNGGFETGDFTGWKQTPAAIGSDFFVDSALPHSGIYAAQFAGLVAGDYDTISQTLQTHAGMSYSLSFYALQYYGSSSNSDFQALWDGTVVYNSSALPGTYTNIVLNELGRGNDVLSFRAYNVPGIDYLDDVSVSTLSPVTVTPELSSLPLLGTGLLGIVAVVRRRGVPLS